MSTTRVPEAAPAQNALPSIGKSRPARRTLPLLAALLLLAIPPRLINLGELSFYGDEEISAFAARSVAEGGDARMPTGMLYRRALPLTWLTAASARLFGEAEEFSYRLPVAIFGALTVPLLFVAGRALVGGRIALVAAVLLALSEWHLVFSRQGRMYVPFLFFFLATAYAIVRWAEEGRARHLWLAAGLFAAAASLHLIGVLAVMFCVLPLLFAGWAAVSPLRLLGLAAALAVAGLAYDAAFVSVPFGGWAIAGGGGSGDGSGAAWIRRWLPDTLVALPSWAVLAVLAGAGTGIWAAARTRPDGGSAAYAVRSVALYASAGLAGALTGAGQLYGAALATLGFLLIHPWPRGRLARGLKAPVAVGCILAAGWAAGSLAAWGPARGIRFLAAYPFPYAAMLADQFPAVLLLFLAMTTWLACRAPDASDRGVRFAALAVILALAGFGAASRWGGTRYLFCVYPFVLLAVAAALVRATDALSSRVPRWHGKAATAVAALVAASGVLGAHGVRQAIRTATLEHGQPVNASMHIFPFHPDHESAGEFIRQVREPGDVVIAEDPLQQRWYAGPIDYWFRRFGDARRYLFRASDGRLRDVYAGSAILADPAALDTIVAAAEGRVWLVTSGETFPLRSWYLSADQRAWLDSLENARSAAFVGRDGVTSVYCLNCPGAAPPQPRPQR